jgi:hypothetical protein
MKFSGTFIATFLRANKKLTRVNQEHTADLKRPYRGAVICGITIEQYKLYLSVSHKHSWKQSLY